MKNSILSIGFILWTVASLAQSPSVPSGDTQAVEQIILEELGLPTSELFESDLLFPLFSTSNATLSPSGDYIQRESNLKVRNYVNNRFESSLPNRVEVFGAGFVIVSPRVTISNGSAYNWGPYPNSFLDARTLSFPAPR